jgi:hypothetical protein
MLKFACFVELKITRIIVMSARLLNSVWNVARMFIGLSLMLALNVMFGLTHLNVENVEKSRSGLSVLIVFFRLGRVFVATTPKEIVYYVYTTTPAESATNQ